MQSKESVLWTLYLAAVAVALLISALLLSNDAPKAWNLRIVIPLCAISFGAFGWVLRAKRGKSGEPETDLVKLIDRRFELPEGSRLQWPLVSIGAVNDFDYIIVVRWASNSALAFQVKQKGGEVEFLDAGSQGRQYVKPPYEGGNARFVVYLRPETRKALSEVPRSTIKTAQATRFSDN